VPSQPQPLLFPPFRLDPANQQLWRDKEEISLRRKTFDVLRFLVDHPGQLVTKEALLDAVWPGVVVGDSMPATCVVELRRALGDDARTPRFIETVHRRGYRFIAQVTAAAAREVAPKPSQPPKRPKSIMVGREEELALLQGWYSQVLEGQRLVLFVAGEAGIGKTTFVQAFLDSIAQEGTPRLGRGQCVEQYGSGEPYMPVLEALSQLSREHGGERVIEVLNKFAPTWLAQMPELLTREERVRLQTETQGVTQQRMLREMTQALEALAAQMPLVLLLEDLHWSDFSTLELISACARRSGPARMLIVGTYRPVEILVKDHPLRTMKQELELHRYCEELRLKLLSEQNVVDYLARRLAGDGSRQFGTLAPVIHGRTDGNPLFMVNMVDYLLVDAGLRASSREVSEAEWAERLGVHRLDALRNIRQMIERNLERLKPEEQAVLEGASVAGAEFSAAAVAAALGRPQDEVEACCMRLSRREQFVSEQGAVAWPDGTVATGFRFNHALYQEVLYSRLPAGHQLQLHRLIALREEAGYGERAREVATELAYHYSRANDKNKAIQYFRLAGERAVDRCAFTEAEKAYRQALTLLKVLEESPERDARELELASALFGVLFITKGYSAGESVEAAARARTLAEKTGNVAQLVRQVYAAWAVALAFPDYPSAIALAHQLLDLAQRENSHASLGFAHMANLQTRYLCGNLTEAEEHFRGLNEHLEDAVFKQFPGAFVIGLGFATVSAWSMGRADAARERFARAIAFACESENPYDLALARFFESWLYQLLKDPEASENASAQALAISEEHGFTYGRYLAQCRMGWARAQLGHASEGVALIRTGLAGLEDIGARQTLTNFLTLLAEAQALDGATADALRTLEEVSQTNPGEIAFRPHSITFRGELELKLGRTELAEASFHEAIALAQTMRATAWELRATMNLARLLDKQGRRDEARTMLADIYHWFTEGFDTADLKDAKTLLDELST
jgi:DNA-binding winged helix-turn-helix (wHTH) protein/tetratricopeptide (TPR) repeat protein